VNKVREIVENDVLEVAKIEASIRRGVSIVSGEYGSFGVRITHEGGFGGRFPVPRIV
jgi:hypothetical protein